MVSLWKSMALMDSVKRVKRNERAPEAGTIPIMFFSARLCGKTK